eukprot:190558-Hanusia_phi.AAC.1
MFFRRTLSYRGTGRLPYGIVTRLSCSPARQFRITENQGHVTVRARTKTAVDGHGGPGPEAPLRPGPGAGRPGPPGSTVS